MTRKRLSQLYCLKKEIRRLTERLACLRAKAERATTNISSLNKGYGNADKVGDVVCVIADLERLIESEKAKCVEEQYNIEKYIDTIPDSLIREIFRLRHVYCYSWQRVAMEVGGYNTADSVRKLHDRYLFKKMCEKGIDK